MQRPCASSESPHGPMRASHAGIFTKPPPEEEAVATIAGLVLNCANSALYMANYNLVVRPHCCHGILVRCTSHHVRLAGQRP